MLCSIITCCDESFPTPSINLLRIVNQVHCYAVSLGESAHVLKYKGRECRVKLKEIRTLSGIMRIYFVALAVMNALADVECGGVFIDYT